MWIQIMNAAEWLLFILLIFNGIQIYRKLKHKEKIPRKTALIFIFIFVLYVMVTRANYCRTHPGRAKFRQELHIIMCACLFILLFFAWD